jgi:peptidoglycan hydrolase CwlO-like protein
MYIALSLVILSLSWVNIHQYKALTEANLTLEQERTKFSEMITASNKNIELLKSKILEQNAAFETVKNSSDIMQTKIDSLNEELKTQQPIITEKIVTIFKTKIVDSCEGRMQFLKNNAMEITNELSK